MKTIVTNIFESAIAEFPGVEIRYITESKGEIEVMFLIRNVIDFRAFRAHITAAANESNMTATFDYHTGSIRGFVTFAKHIDIDTANKITVETYQYIAEQKGCGYAPETAVQTTIDGHDVFILESAHNGTQRDCAGNISYHTPVFRENTERVMCAWVFGRTGKSLRWRALIVNARTGKPIPQTGFDGATNHGRGATLRLIDWDGSKYAAAVEQSMRTGKKLL